MSIKMVCISTNTVQFLHKRVYFKTLIRHETIMNVYKVHTTHTVNKINTRKSWQTAWTHWLKCFAVKSQQWRFRRQSYLGVNIRFAFDVAPAFSVMPTEEVIFIFAALVQRALISNDGALLSHIYFSMKGWLPVLISKCLSTKTTDLQVMTLHGKIKSSHTIKAIDWWQQNWHTSNSEARVNFNFIW